MKESQEYIYTYISFDNQCYFTAPLPKDRCIEQFTEEHSDGFVYYKRALLCLYMPKTIYINKYLGKHSENLQQQFREENQQYYGLFPSLQELVVKAIAQRITLEQLKPSFANSFFMKNYALVPEHIQLLIRNEIRLNKLDSEGKEKTSFSINY